MDRQVLEIVDLLVLLYHKTPQKVEKFVNEILVRHCTLVLPQEKEPKNEFGEDMQT